MWLLEVKFDNPYLLIIVYTNGGGGGASISCALHKKFATAMHWLVVHISNNRNVVNYLDDILFVGRLNLLTVEIL